ncbi:hypothetical protein C0993_004638 [Termitomyces sp. T159_Od127]|nr:hypothetical protein C0993_004638 [Termitomyces sp. T159_Od127]
MARSVVRVHHPTSVRSVAFSPSNWQPLHAIVGLDNGSIYRWDLKMGQRGLQDRLSVAHTASVTSLDWCNRNSQTTTSPTTITVGDSAGNGMGWLASAGLDRCVKVWDLTAPGVTHIPNKPTYILHPSFPVRRVVWRPLHECELAVVSNAEFSSGSNHDLSQNGSTGGAGESEKRSTDNKTSVGGDAVEIWDARRCWIPKWSVTGSAIEGGVTANVLFSPLDHRVLAEKRQIKVKALGDNCYVPVSQDLGTFNVEPAHNIEVFSRLARGYIFYGEDRPTICAINARVALQASREELAQTWLLLGASLADLIPTTPTTFSPTKGSSVQPTTPHAVTSPTITSNPVTSPHIPSNLSSYPTSISTSSKLRKSSPNHASILTSSRSASTSTSRKITPASSNASSPRQMPIGLPSTTPRRPSFFAGSRNVDAESSRRPSISVLRRPSISVSGSHSLSPADKANLRHVGEGALDDSDSSSDEESDVHRQSSDEESGVQQLVSPGFLPVRSTPAPSPLSRVAGRHQWAEDEVVGRNTNEDGDDDSSSPSPGSTDTDSPQPNVTRRRKVSKVSASRPARRHSSLMHSHRRASTVESLTAPPTPSVSRTDSYSSIRTVLATEAPVQEVETGLRQEETIRDMCIVPQGRRGPELAVDQSTAVNNLEDEIDPDDLTERHVKIVSDDEKRLRKLAWTALRDALEDYAEEVTIQSISLVL